MSNFIKPPMLSTSFSETGQRAKNRFDNIFNTKSKKRGLLALVLVVCVIITVGTLVACDNKSIGIIGGADGPTAIYTSDNYLEKLYGSKIKYIGDNSGVGNILNLVFAANEQIKDFELKTAEKEPKGIVVNLNGKLQEDALREAKAITALLLVENCDYIKLSYEDNAADYTKAEAEAKYGVKFSEVIKGFDSFSEFYRSIFGLSSNIPIEQRIASLIIRHNSGGYLDGECQAEGHIILGTEGSVPAGSDTKTPDKTYIYALVTYGEYGFQNDNFTKVSGSGVIPVRITLDKDGNVTEYLEAMDGSENVPSIKRMFPEALWERALSGDKADYEICKKQERAYAESYLKSIGREAAIGEYGDFEQILPVMDTEASNKLLEMYPEYPYWIGTEERIEAGIRYVYEKEWDSEKKIVTFKKYEYDTKKVVEEAVINASGGELVYLKGTPRKEHYSKYN